MNEPKMMAPEEAAKYPPLKAWGSCEFSPHGTHNGIACCNLGRVDSVEAWAKRKKIAPWLFKAAAIGAHWECGPQVEPCLVTEAEFDRAVAFAENPHAVVNAPKEPK